MPKKRLREPDVVNGVRHWQCTTCQHWFPEPEMATCTANWSGISTNCKKCQKAYYAKWYKQNGRDLQQKRRISYKQGA
jgi:hypothetical protein